ncbi:MAG TPA: hypothetical protein VJH55_04035 [Candidatus Paceibacterota bacterium]
MSKGTTLKVSNKRNTAFTLIELIISLAAITLLVGVVGFGLIGAVCMGNEWFTEEGVLREIKAQNAKVQEIVTYKRKIFKKSEITVKVGETNQVYLLESNILMNYTVTLK